MDSEAALSAYTPEQVKIGEKLPERISSIAHNVEAGEKLKLDLVTEHIAEVTTAIRDKTGEKFVVLGSMGMYATLNELRSDGQQLMILEQRIAGGKNDYDIGVRPDALATTMSNFSWNPEAQKLQRGYVGESRQMVDLMGRGELPHFPWRETNINGATFFVQSPEEMIFEKMTALINPGNEDTGKARLREVKWGVDTKLLKTYLIMKNGWTEDRTEEYLAGKWNDYIEDTRYQGVSELTQEIETGKPIAEVVKKAIQKRLGKEQVDNPKQDLLAIFGQQSETLVDTLLQSSTGGDFSVAMKSLLDQRAGGKLAYTEATSRATAEFNKLVATFN